MTDAAQHNTFEHVHVQLALQLELIQSAEHIQELLRHLEGQREELLNHFEPARQESDVTEAALEQTTEPRTENLEELAEAFEQTLRAAQRRPVMVRHVSIEDLQRLLQDLLLLAEQASEQRQRLLADLNPDPYNMQPLYNTYFEVVLKSAHFHRERFFEIMLMSRLVLGPHSPFSPLHAGLATIATADSEDSRTSTGLQILVLLLSDRDPYTGEAIVRKITSYVP
eukprot:gnl/TRDRNA2_/TRDRNA2_45702_c0_seq1.p1 gnl/TRDRNA2_/TRDRNA2_45702_c0~~gnl/TRDRNA2_/TRDRNA2_45702_c0_seq1.p1  ORF type:complete len:225 (-),score=50.94 gnl/TRDRNA2_/TRDRNA2_45702_c0_seq1:58-732(-)